MAGNRSREALIEFLDWVETKGLLPSGTIQGRKAAVNRVLSVLDSQEAQDVTQLDLDHIMDRFINLNSSGYTPDSLRTYRGRVGSSIRDFDSYVSNPMAFRPVRPLKLKSGKQEKSAPKAADAPTKQSEPFRAPSTPMPGVNLIPIPLRADLTVRLEGVPFDLTMTEARRIANVVIALAVPDAEGG